MNGTLRIIITLGLFLTSQSFSEETPPKFEISGELINNVYMEVDDGFGNHLWYNNQEYDILTAFNYSEKTRVEVWHTIEQLTPFGKSPVSDIWNPWLFYGLTFSYKATDNFTFYAGDLVYIMGQLNYYAYHRPIMYSALNAETFIRGAGFAYKNLTVYAGPYDSGDSKPFDLFASYSLALSDDLSIVPKGDVRVGGDNTDFHAGVEANLEGDLSLHGVIGVIGKDGKDPTVNFLLEPEYSKDALSVKIAVFYSLLGDDPSAPDGAVGIPDEYFVYAEPGLNFMDKFRVSASLEYHGGATSELLDTTGTAIGTLKDDAFWLVPGLRFLPNDEIEIWTFARGVFLTEAGRKPFYDIGLQATVNF